MRSRRLGVCCRALAGFAVVLATLGGCGKSLPVLGGAAGGHQGLLRLGPGQCKPGAPLAGVYLPFRLHLKNRCVTVRGTVNCVRREDDGDIHIRLRVDPAYRRLLIPANGFQQCPGHTGPHLVVEIIPQHGHLPFLTNSATSGGFVTPAAPAPGEHVAVTGAYVWDSNALHELIYPGKNAKDWAEIHPAWNVTVTG